jgi:hypothetical protein
VALALLGVSHSKSVLYGAFVWARRALNRPFRWFSARADHANPPTGASAQRWKKAKVLIIDEVSMVGDKMFDVLDVIGCRLRAGEGALGGLQVIVGGDFLQLQPVAAKHTFQAGAWEKAQFKTVLLERVLRQRDPAFATILSQLRTKSLSPESHEWLRTVCALLGRLSDLNVP